MGALYYAAFFTESDVAGGYVGEHYYIKIPDPNQKFFTLPTALGDSPSLNDTLQYMRRIVELGIAVGERIVPWFSAQSNPPTITAMILNAQYGGFRFRELMYIVLDPHGCPIESGCYTLNHLIKQKETVL